MAVNPVRNSTSTIESVGGIGQIITSFGSIAKNISGGQPQNQSQDISSLILSNLNLEQETINPRQYEIIKGIFQQYAENESLIEAYTLLALDAINKFGVRFTDLIEDTEDDSLQFTEVGIALLNQYRPLTSQIARRKLDIERDTNKFVKRQIIA
tara:strand:- start:934 stop:1395 length:462 start_codon:yes stop_codon:yes gene_type:complete